jgi:hypothetical protein
MEDQIPLSMHPQMTADQIKMFEIDLKRLEGLVPEWFRSVPSPKLGGGNGSGVGR